MYEYLVENLISYNQVDGNLRRTADRGLVSELYRRQMNALALKYFGVDSNGIYTENKEDIVAYRCPYSGEIISDLSTAHLEHILPVSSNGGTVLFNCVPILDKVNLSKRAEANLLVWWQEQNYFNYDRLERLIQYMLEAYTLAFKEPTEEELYDYDNSLNSDDYIENDDLSIDLKDKTSNQTNINIQQTITYYQLINDLINELSKNRDVSKYNSQLNSLKEQSLNSKKYEVLIILNGEKDSYYYDINEWLKNNNVENFKLFYIEQKGVSNARNIGLDSSKGEYIVFVDDDDYVDKNYLEELLNKNKEIGKKGIVITNYINFEEKNKKILFQSKYLLGNIEEQLYRKRKVFSMIWMKIIPLEVIKDIRFNINFKNGEDALFMLEISKNIEKIGTINKESFYYRRVRKNSANFKKQRKKEIIINKFELLKEYKKIFLKTKKRRIFIFMRMLAVLKGMIIKN